MAIIFTSEIQYNKCTYDVDRTHKVMKKKITMIVKRLTWNTKMILPTTFT